MKRTYILTLLLLISCTILADDPVQFRAEAPSRVVVGKPFQLTYSVNQRARDLKAPEFTDFDYLAGPYSSQSSSTSFVNGKRTSSFSLTFTYTLMATKEGTFSIAPATISVDGNPYTSNGVKIEVLPADQTASSASATSNGQKTASGQTADNGVSSENIFVRTIVSKTTVHEQEAIMLSYKLYFAGVDVAQLTNNTKLPDFTGFLKQELEQGEIQTELEHYNGRNYQSCTLYQTLLYPQHSGDITIAPAQFEAVLRVAVRQQVRSIFDDFFGSYSNVSKMLTAPGATIHVKSMPAGKPACFSGAVGKLQMTGTISNTDVPANEAITIQLRISGNGNLKLIKTPNVDWPEGFETYDPKVTNDFKSSPSGMNGTKTIEYLAIPRTAGEYTIPAIQFAYFDTQSNQYQTLSVGGWTLHIQRPTGDNTNNGVVQNYVNREQIKQIGTDIRFIHTGRPKYTKSEPRTIQSPIWLYLIPLVIACVLFVVFRRQIQANADITRVRYRKANKVAKRLLTEAMKQMKVNNKTAFYEAIEKAAWNYLSDRLSIPTSNLNKENISSILRDKGVEEILIEEVNNVLSTAEFARYAPTDDNLMQDLYQRTENLINLIENQKI